MALAAGCSTLEKTPDLAVNPRLYTDVAYESAAPGDVEVFVAPTVDQRDGAALPTHDHGYPIRYGGDDFWQRPVAVMVGAASELVAAATICVVPAEGASFSGTATAAACGRAGAALAACRALLAVAASFRMRSSTCVVPFPPSARVRRPSCNR